MIRATETSDFWRRLTEMIGRELTVKQQEVAKIFRVGQSAVTKWKTGKDTPGLPRAVEMAEKYGVCVEWLLTGRGPKHPHDAPDAELARLLEFWKQLQKDDKREVVSFALYKQLGTINPDDRNSDVHGSSNGKHKRQNGKPSRST